jgi:hypothetical protein
MKDLPCSTGNREELAQITQYNDLFAHFVSTNMTYVVLRAAANGMGSCKL